MTITDSPTSTSTAPLHHQSGVDLDIRPLSGTIGAEIHGLDLATLDDETSPRSARSGCAYKVVFFPEQHLSPDEHRTFAARSVN